jgi:single-strand DNA-binding protein
MKTITIAGRLGGDAEMKTTNGGTEVCKFSVATDSKRSGERVTTWFDVSIFGKRGASLCQFLKKGSAVTVVGDLEARTYEARDGSTKMALGVVCSEIALLGGGKDSNDSPRPRRNESDGGSDPFGSDSDIPFAPRGNVP